MASTNQLKSGWMKVVEILWPLPMLILLYWAVRYWHYAQFGFYEDDHHYVLRAINMPQKEFFPYLFNLGHILRFYDAGHPLHPRLITLGTKTGWWLGEVRGIYWVSFFIGSVNIALFYTLLRRMHSVSLGVIGALIYVLYTADTTQAYLTFALGLQPSITFFLLAAHAYLSGSRWLPYGFAVLSLFTYETVFPVFFALPLLGGIEKQDKFRIIRRHMLLTAAILIGVIIWRAAVGENRLSALSFGEAISTPILHSLQGPIVVLGTLLYRPIQVLQLMTPDLWTVIGILAIGITLMLLKVYPNTVQKEGSGARSPQNTSEVKWIRRLFHRDQWEQIDQRIKSLLWFAGTGLAMLILAYPLTFTVRAIAISGRDTRVHAAGVLGAALLLGSLTVLALALLRIQKAKMWAALGFGIWLSFLGAFGFIVQRDYVIAWDYQQEFWSTLIASTPDLEDGTMILVDPEGLEDPRFIAANTWSLPNVLKHLYVFPDDWGEVPRVHRLLQDWRSRTSENSIEIKALDYMWEYVVVSWDDVILLETEGGLVSNRLETLQLDGVDYSLNRYERDGSLTLPKTRLYPYFVNEQ
jgi:hypothetical protein